MRQVFTLVQVINPQHPRHDQAGYVVAVDPAKPDEVAVKFDIDGQVQAVLQADLRQLA